MAKIGEVKLAVSGGTVTLPVYELSDIGSGVYDFIRVMTESGVGAIPFTEPSNAAYQYLRIQTQSQGLLAAHDDPVFATLIDDFEDGNIGEYSGNTGSYSVRSGGISGSNYLQTSTNNTVIKSLPGDGLPYYPSRGDIVEWWTYENGNGNAAELWLGAQDYSGTGGGYNVAVVTSTSGETYMRIGTEGGTGDDVGSSTAINGAEKEWVRCRLEWGDPTMTFEVYDTDGNLYGTVSGDDTQYDSGGIGFDTSWSNNSNSEPYDQRWDYIRKVGEV